MIISHTILVLLRINRSLLLKLQATIGSHHLEKRISLKRNESNLSYNEIKGESVVQWLKRQSNKIGDP